MKKISVLVACYNEVDNVDAMAKAITDVMTRELPQYDREIVFIDNYSTDGTREHLEAICAADKHIKAIFNAANFGQLASPVYGIRQTTGDCTIGMACDFQDPPEMIPQFVHEWEAGHRIVLAQKTKSEENPFIYFLRSCYYKMIRKMSSAKMIDNCTGFGLYDKSFVDILRQIDDPRPWIRGIVGEYGSGFNLLTIPFDQPLRAKGHSSNNFYTLYDFAMLSFTTYTKVGLRIATFIGFIAGFVSLGVALWLFIMKLRHWDSYPLGYATQVILMCLFASIQLFFIGVLGEYVMNINTRVIDRPLVVEERRINFDDDKHGAL